MFESEKSVRALLQACSQDLLSPDGLSEYYFKMSSRRMRCKEVSRAGGAAGHVQGHLWKKGKGWNSSRRRAGSWLALTALCLWWGCVSSVFVSFTTADVKPTWSFLG